MIARATNKIVNLVELLEFILDISIAAVVDIPVTYHDPAAREGKHWYIALERSSRHPFES